MNKHLENCREKERVFIHPQNKKRPNFIVFILTIKLRPTAKFYILFSEQTDFTASVESMLMQFFATEILHCFVMNIYTLDARLNSILFAES
mgnify:CR=1 FL=1